MFKNIFIIFLLAHILGDFYFQSNKLAENKKSEISAVFKHAAIYAAVTIAVMLPIMLMLREKIWSVVLATLVVAASHALIDCSKYFMVKRCNPKKEQRKYVYISDQSFHLVIIAVVSYFVAVRVEMFPIPLWISEVFDNIGVLPKQLFLWIFAVLFIHKPINITVKQILDSYKPMEQPTKSDNAVNSNNAGAFIGTLERLLILLFLSLNQYAAIALVLTAKSIARYDKIAHDPAFAEYYLLGTLLSTATAIITYILFL
jgi:hypothetical protein